LAPVGSRHHVPVATLRGAGSHVLYAGETIAKLAQEARATFPRRKTVHAVHDD